MPEEPRNKQPYPSAPEIERRVRVPLFRGIGMVLILLVPALAIAGVFGESRDTAAARGPNVSVRMEFPSRYRYRMLNTLTLAVENTSERKIDTVTVRLDTAYVLRFSTVVITPAPEQAFLVPLTDVAPGEIRLVVMELQGERYGRHSGQVHVETTSGDTLALPVHTLIYP
jgi:hypothetical protein